MLMTLIRATASALLVIAMATASVAQVVPPSAGGAARVQLPVDALMQDAAEYAQRFGVPFDEALRRMRAQGDSVPATDALRETFKDRWAGIAIEHLPNYRIVVLLTGTDPVVEQSVMAGGMTVPIIFRTGAAATREAVLEAITRYQAKIRDSLPHPPGLGVDQRAGELVVMTASADADLDRNGELRARIAAMTGVPVRIDIVDRPPVDMAQDQVVPVPTLIPAPVDGSAIEGGGRVVGTVDGKRYACTTGFVVSDGVRNGVVTAAHCPDTLSYVGKRPSDGGREEWPLAFVGQWGWGYQDVQVNVATAPDVGYAPLFYADTAKTLARPVATWRYRTSTRAGDFVCHRGERTGYSCAVIAMVDFAPAGDLCGGACLPTWVAVEGPTCKAGDSGAPVFEGSTALGLVKGGTYRRDGTCLFYYYMSTDYLPQGWTLLHR
ncbi:S1 family peptidase [Sphingomonas sp. CFBP 13603]|uniref:S1 family peptidase n=1 Tax=Sphingomonas sp. CFBP 13603 TaxID=2774040 RepID=UPI001FD35B54|nr:S1 family peptidase [Sphingomonas sp. CFBP 13603]